jgi:hypothetical protein
MVRMKKQCSAPLRAPCRALCRGVVRVGFVLAVAHWPIRVAPFVSYCAVMGNSADCHGVIGCKGNGACFC